MRSGNTLAGQFLAVMFPNNPTNFAHLDFDRPGRTGVPEVVWGLGKTPAQIASILQQIYDQSGLAMATRIAPDIAQEIQSKLAHCTYDALAEILLVGTPQVNHPGVVGVITAGTADQKVAQEVLVTLQYLGWRGQAFTDVGVAGIHRLLARWPEIQPCDVLIVVAGMEGALPSVVAGLSQVPVIGVPTSVGYGAQWQGLAPLLTMLNSCAPGVAVVNIDNGFGAAVLAGQILRVAARFAGGC
ncbi:circadian phase modifier CpmA-like protein [Gloeomargarita lithophora Alchichica-D10]|uniref:Circadian phase modifier CpmA-like protein n=1 Tax=Gloeomargarita lithophora Alchichica-D10 TaxID=1188229 RepID=A0A1J0AD66_9CYAN|nr:nickel pincer cofactor biosynthesis protein LarB [Gloeomargarita lithophora]APB33859.1 circadian phase modifier CpmA-like protein [Gloeomargarita lithophora Alchichica-D10]